MIPYTNSAHSSLSAYFITLLKCQSSRAQTWTSNLVWWMRWTFWPFATRNQIKFIVHKSSYVRGGTASRMTAGAITDMMSHIAVLHMWASKATWVCDYDPLFQQSTTDNPWSLDISSKSWSWQPIQQQRLKDAAKTWTLQGPYHWEGTEEVKFSRGYNGSYP